MPVALDGHVAAHPIWREAELDLRCTHIGPMANQQDLRTVLAEFLSIDPASLDGDFALIGPRLHGSIARYALSSAIRRRLGLHSPVIFTAGTYGELEAALLGGASTPMPAHMTTALIPPSLRNGAADSAMAQNTLASLSCGVDIELVENLPEAADYWTSEFYADAFTHAEIAYCLMQENPRVHFAGRWCAKEALKKCDARFAGVSMAAIEVERSESGALSLSHVIDGISHRLPHAVSISHTTLMATAIVVGVGQA
jgi:phosphopantetheine--protein transferase-like protein